MQEGKERIKATKVAWKTCRTSSLSINWSLRSYPTSKLSFTSFWNTSYYLPLWKILSASAIEPTLLWRAKEHPSLLLRVKQHASLLRRLKEHFPLNRRFEQILLCFGGPSSFLLCFDRSKNILPCLGGSNNSLNYFDGSSNNILCFGESSNNLLYFGGTSNFFHLLGGSSLFFSVLAGQATFSFNSMVPANSLLLRRVEQYLSLIRRVKQLFFSASMLWMAAALGAIVTVRIPTADYKSKFDKAQPRVPFFFLFPILRALYQQQQQGVVVKKIDNHNNQTFLHSPDTNISETAKSRWGIWHYFLCIQISKFHHSFIPPTPIKQ